MEFSYSGQYSGWHDYSGEDWDERKPIDWLHDWAFWKYCVDKYACSENQATPLPILELACGNGRITRQLVLAEYDVVAVDINPHFLSRAQNAMPTETEHRADFYLQDVVQLNLERLFQLAIMADWAFPALLTQADQRQFLQRLNQHLVIGGIFAFNTTFSTPRQQGLVPTPDGWQWANEPRTFDALTQVETAKHGPHPIRFRHNTLDEITLLAELAGFRIIERFGGADFRPLRGIAGDDLTLILQKE